MEKIAQKEIDWLMNLGRKKYGKNRYAFIGSDLRKNILQICLGLAGLFGLIILPFFLLIRTSVYLKLTHGFAGWAALGGGMIAAILLLITYILLLFRNIQNKKLLLKYSLAGVSTMVVGFCMFSLFYLSGVNAKSSEVRELYRSMHPIMRVAISTITLADGGLVVTEIGRVPADYERMGLPVNPASLHYIQHTGYVHAVDLRTNDRSYLRNILLRYSLQMMGFRTLYHKGTAHHLHVELAVRRNQRR
ncbi:MAG: hypothetical protein EA390_02060 [Balneolaceae bacterium]|nr:MAG: hypothetical protein EA390_02060 [Balneolaceae bacterium]